MSYSPALLISYAYMKVDTFEKTCHTWRYRELIIDSGAWTAHTTGKEVKLGEYIDACRRIKAADPIRVTGFFSLDVIGDWKASLRNTEAMWKAGIEAIPVFHYGEPVDALLAMASSYPKISIGGIAKDHAAKKLKFAEQSFAKVWPKKIHGLGYGGEEFITKLPFHSVDASSWKMGAAFGRWKSFGVRLEGRIPQLSRRNEAEYFQQIERTARGRWMNTMPKIGATVKDAPTVYLATQYTNMDKKWLEI